MNTQLINGVVAQLSCDSIEEARDDFENVYNNGASGGYSGFIYYNETIKFFDDNKELILENLEELAQSVGESKYKMIAGFNCLDVSEDDVVEAIYTEDHEEETAVKNALAWYALEEVARHVIENEED